MTAFALLSKRFGLPYVDWIGSHPILRQITLVKYDELIIGFCLCMLASAGCADLIERRVRMSAIVIAVSPIAIIIADVAIRYHSVVSALPPARRCYHEVAIVVARLELVSVAKFAVALSLAANQKRIRFYALAIVVAVFAEPHLSYIIPLFYVLNPLAPQSADAPRGAPYVTYLREHLHGARFFAERHFLCPEWSDAFAVSDTRALDALYPERYLTFVNRFIPPHHGDGIDRFFGASDINFSQVLQARFLQLASIELIATTRQIVSERTQVVARFGEVSILRNRSALPRVAIYDRVRPAKTGGQALEILANVDFDPTREVIIENPSTEALALKRVPSTPVRAEHIIYYGADEVRISVEDAGRSLVVLNDTADPGWNANIDDHPTPILTANYFFRGVVVPPGKHIITFHYRPITTAIGFVLCGFSFAIILLAIMFQVFRQWPMHRE